METLNATNTLFIIISALLVLLMTPAIAIFYSGMTKSKNALSTIMNSFLLLSVISLQWVIIGYSIAFGVDHFGLFGGLNFTFLDNVTGLNDSKIPNILFMLFQMMFAIIAGAIITGSLVGRMKFGVLLVFILLWSTFVYDPLAHLIWSENGWLLTRGSLDFAGGGVVHISSGVAGLIGAIMLGKQKGFGTSSVLPHNLPFSFIGAILLFIGWLGFNSGSALAVDDIAVNAFIVTILAAFSGILSWVIIEWIKFKKPTLLGGITGLIAALVAITPAAGFVSPISSILIGFIASPICFYAMYLIKTKLKLDDSLDAFSLHGVGGIWGGIATGLFASAKINPSATGEGTLGEGLLIGGKYDLFLEQILAIIICIILSAIISFVILKIISLFTPLRVDQGSEENGLDVSLHGEEAYRKA